MSEPKADEFALTVAAMKKSLLQKMRALEQIEKLAATLTHEEREDLRSIITTIKK